MFSIGTNPDIDRKNRRNATGNTISGEILNGKVMFSFQNEGIQNTESNSDYTALEQPKLYKRLNGNFRKYLVSNVRSFFARRYEYFDILASNIFKKRKTN